MGLRAASPLCSKAVSKPSRLKTSQSRSQVTESSSTVRICGVLRGIYSYLSARFCLDSHFTHWKTDAKFRTLVDSIHAFDLPSMSTDDFFGNTHSKPHTHFFW